MDALAVQQHDGLLDVVHEPTGALATFDVSALDRDGIPIWEVWGEDTYGVTDELVDGVVIDVGAHVGSFSILAATLGARVIAYEPSAAYPRLIANVERNRLAEVVEPHRAAVGAEAGERVYVDGIGGSAHVVSYATDRHVPMVAINDILSRFDEVACLKIDCEGCEWPLFGALDDALLCRVRHLRMEFHAWSVGMPWLDHEPARPARLLLRLAEFGAVHIMGRPSTGGLISWDRY